MSLQHFECSLEEFKQLSLSVCRLIDRSAFTPEVEKAWKLLSLYFVNFKGTKSEKTAILNYFMYVGALFSEYSSVYYISNELATLENFS